ncbi:MAG TPA: chromosomal replication initiator protein DnaA [Planctomycetota bacterium]|nr:chromosomal replication initiator protein DnaA [Planctomycetota bacterium]
MMPLTNQDKEKILSFLESRLEPKVYDTWCRSLELEPAGDNAYRVPTANPFYRDWLEKLLRKPLEDAFSSLFGRTPDLVFQVNASPLAVLAPAAPPSVPTPAAIVEPAPATPDFVYNPNYTFENFIEGPSNRMAFAAAVAVSENPATLYNPLFIHGGVGLGKTHLLQAICHSILTRNSSAKVHYLSCEDFVNGYIYAIQKKTLEAFRTRYRNADVLVVDDIHFLADKEGSQEEFFHTFNALHMAGRQMILSSDQPAGDIRSLTQQLLSRFRSGFEARIMSPAYETRLAILRGKAAARQVEVSQEVLGYIASIVESNIRELEGALTKVLGYAALSKRPVDLVLAQEVLKEVPPPSPASMSITEIQQVVARYFHKKVSDLHSRRWTKSTSQARQICIYLCRKFTGTSLEELGSHFGGKDHSTMLYSIRKVEKLLTKNASVRGDVERLTREISSK